MNLFGRRDIYTSASVIDETNVLAEVNKALRIHALNMSEMEYLYWYRRGNHPVLERVKEVNKGICNTVVENHADEIVAFKNGYLLTAPAFYVSRNSDKTDKVRELNEYLYRSGKQDADNDVVDWFHTVGKAAILVEPNADNENPVSVYALDPRSAFVVYSLRPGHKPVMGINVVVVDDDKVMFDVFTDKNVFRLLGGYTQDSVLITQGEVRLFDAQQLVGVERNMLNAVPIIEYKYSTTNMGAFESTISLLDAIDLCQSNRLDGVEQFIQSIAVAVNCQFEEGTTADDIRKAGMIVLRSIGENRADFKILAEELNQTQTQVLKDDLYEQVLTICGMPGASRNSSSTSDTGMATLIRNGWSQADTFRRNTEDLFRKSNACFDKIFLYILKKRVGLDLSTNDFDLKFSEGEMQNIQSRAQACSTMLAFGLHPELAFSKSGISFDPANDVAMSKPYLDMRLGNPFAPATEENKPENGGMESEMKTVGDGVPV